MTMQILTYLDRADERGSSPSDEWGIRDGVLRNGHREVQPIERPSGEMAPIESL